MKGYEAKDLEQLFGSVGRIRKGKTEFANDNTYWEGGHCNWGANHVLREDCETLARGFGKIETLGDIKKSLKECTDETEFNYKKQDFLTTVNNAINNLRPNMGGHSSMFGICIIWAHEAMNKYVKQKIDGCKREMEKIKNSLENETYKWVKEINQIDLEITQIEDRMEENKQKAMRPDISPSEKLVLIADIETDGKLLKQKYAEKQKLENKFDFDPVAKVRDMVEEMKRAIERSAKGGSGSGGNNSGDGSGGNRRNKNKNGSGGSSGGSGSNPDGNQDPNQPPRGKKEAKPEKDNSSMIFLAIAVIVIFFLITNQSKSQRSHDYEEFDYY